MLRPRVSSVVRSHVTSFIRVLYQLCDLRAHSRVFLCGVITSYASHWASVLLVKCTSYYPSYQYHKPGNGDEMLVRFVDGRFSIYMAYQSNFMLLLWKVVIRFSQFYGTYTGNKNYAVECYISGYNIIVPISTVVTLWYTILQLGACGQLCLYAKTVIM